MTYPDPAGKIHCSLLIRPSMALSNLPSRGFFKNVTDRFVLEQTESITFLPTKDTLPSDRQIITTDKTNILIRSLLLRRQRHAGGSLIQSKIIMSMKN